MIGAIPCECPNKCGNNTTLGNLEEHIRRCPNRKFACVGACKFEGVKADFLKHIVENHEQKVLLMFDLDLVNDH